MRLRGQVGALSQEKAAIGSQRALNKLTAVPETRKMMRDQQKAEMSALDTDLAKQLKRTPEFTGKFNDLLVLFASEDAWRWLRWVELDHRGHLLRIEAFGNTPADREIEASSQRVIQDARPVRVK